MCILHQLLTCTLNSTKRHFLKINFNVFLSHIHVGYMSFETLSSSIHSSSDNRPYVLQFCSTVNSKFTISKEYKGIMDIDLIYEPCVIFQICLYTIHHFNFVHAAIKVLRYWYGSAELIETFLKNLEPYWGFLKLQGKIEAINS